MLVFEIVIALLLGGAALAGLARYLRMPYPALVALAGAGLATVPGLPSLTLDPELALTLFVAPVLLDAAFDASPRDLRANWRTVTGLALGAVVLTVAAVALALRWLVPDMPLAAAVALGAIVAPPDAAAATAVLRQLRPPHRLLVILEGESLFNDASALLVYRLAVGVVAGGVTIGWNVVPTLLLTTIGSVVLALVLARVLLAILTRIDDVSTAVIGQFCTTFAVWMLAERLHLSGILTTVVYAMAISRRAGQLVPARIRIPSYAVWEVAVFVLNVLAFILVGFQLRTILVRLDGATLREYLWIAAAVCAVIMLARLAWVAGVSAVERALTRSPESGKCRGLTGPEAGVVGWCGMRGIVTLAAALALPDGAGGAAFPYRDLILLTAFSAVLVTLVVQGLTLRPLLLWLRVEDDGAVDTEVRLAREETARAALSAIEACAQSPSAALVRDRYAHQLSRAEAERSTPTTTSGVGGPDSAQPLTEDDACALEAIEAAMRAERQRLLDLRASGRIGDAAFQLVEQEIDWAELDLRQAFRLS
jgi:Na+/H+ antiporter